MASTGAPRRRLNKEEQEMQKELEKMYINITPDGGVRKIILAPGDGPTPNKGQKVAIHYNVTLEDGTVVGDTFEQKTPLKLTIGGETSIQGVNLAVESMRFGEKIRLEIDPKYGFGAMNNVHGFHGYGVKIPPNSKLYFELHLLPLELAVAKTTTQWVETAEASKLAGNTAFQAGETEKAKAEYENVLKVVESLRKQLGATPSYEGKTPEEIEKLKAEKKENETKVNALYVTAHLNIAAVYLKQNKFDDTKEHCRKVLEQDPKNVKALYRLAKAHKEVNQFESAIEYLTQASLVQSGPDIMKELNECKRLHEEKLQREKATYKNMFAKLGKEEGLYEGVEPGKAPIWKCHYCGEEMEQVQKARHIIKAHSGEKKKKLTNKDLGLPDQVPIEMEDVKRFREEQMRKGKMI